MTDTIETPKALFIDGQWVPARSGGRINVVNPATGQVMTTLARGGAEDIDLAVSAACRAFDGEWARWSAHDRQRLLLRVHDLVEKNFDELARTETMDMGAPLSRTRSLWGWLSQAILFYASQTAAGSVETLKNSLLGSFVTAKMRAPVGVVGGIIPWNAPLLSQWWILGPALATGCTVVLKPAEDASLTVLRMAELLQEAGLPDGVVNIVTGLGADAGAALSAHDGVDRVAFTGSVETARHIIRASAGNIKRLSLELGGKSPNVVFADADLDKAVPGAAMACYANSGQICAAGTRLFVQRSIADDFTERLVGFTKGLRLGNGLDDVDLGPLISQRQMKRVLGYMQRGSEDGARLAIGGGRVQGEDGFFVQPTIFAGATNDMTIAREEIFGPVLTVIPFDTIDEALHLANATEYGLAAGVWTQNLTTAHRMTAGIKAGTVWINCYGSLDPRIGFGGTKKSGYGWKGSPEHVESFLYTKAVYTKLD